jgi:glycosyltransferase 2 family protein
LTRKNVGAVVGVAVTLAIVAFIVYRFRTSGFSWSEFAAALEGVDWTWLALSLALILATYVGRALRWQVMLRPLKENTRLWPVFSATVIGFTAVVLFGRAGEAVRPYLIAKKEGVTISSQVAAWVVERMLDLLMVLLVFGIALTQVSRSAIQHGPRVKIILEAGGYTAGFTGAACLALLIGLRQFRGKVQQRLMDGLKFLPEPVTAKIAKALQSFGEGMESMRSGSRTMLLVVYTVVEWIVIAGSFGCAFKAFPETHGLGVTDVVILLGFVCFGSIVQLPGIGGGMQLVTILMLTEFFGISPGAASGIALVLWIISFVAIVPVGLVLAFREGINWRSLRHIES